MSRCYPFPPPGYIKELEILSKKEKRKHKDKKKKRKHKDNASNGDLILQEDGSSERVQQSGLADEGFRIANERLSGAKSALPVAPAQGNLRGLQNDIVRERVPSNCALANNAESPEQKWQSCKINSEGQVLSTKSELLHADIHRENVLRNGCLDMDITRSPQSMQVGSPTKGLTSRALAIQSERLKADRPEQRWQSGELNNEGQVLLTKRELLHADIHRESLPRNGCAIMGITRSPQILQVESATKVVTSSLLATQSKRLKTENSREKMTSNGSTAATCKRAEERLQAGCVANELFSNGVLSTKRKRLQADNQEGKPVPGAAPTSLCSKRPQALYCGAGGANTEVASSGVPATDRMSLQADRPSNKYLNHAITSERCEPRLQADNSHNKAVRDGAQAANIRGGIVKAKELSQSLHEAVIDGAQAASVEVGTVKAKELPQHLHKKAVRDGAQAESVQVETVRAKELSQHLHKRVREGAQAASIQVGSSVKAKELSQHLHTTNSKLQADKQKHEVKSRSTTTTKCQADNVRAKVSSNGAHAGKSVQTVQPGNAVPNCVRDSAVKPLVNFSENTFSGAVCATNAKFLQGDTFAKGVFVNGAAESTKRVRVGGVTPEAASHVARVVSCERIEPAGHSQHDAISNGVLDDDGRLPTDESCTDISSQRSLGTHEKFDCSRFQEDQAEKKTMSNGVLTRNCEEFNPDLPSLAVARAEEAAKDVTPVIPASRGNVERNDDLTHLCRRLPQPRALQVCAIADEDDEWLISSSNQRQAKPGEKWDSQIPQVWADAVPLPSLGINALPYVILS